MYSLLRRPVCRRAGSGPQGLCGRCQKGLLDPLVGSFELSLGVYDGALERAVRAYKFGNVRRLGKFFGAALADSLTKSGWEVNLLCAVPLHPVRLMQRGYNQSALLAQAAAKRSDLPYRAVLKRVRSTRQQARLGGGDRQGNVAGAFASLPLYGEAVVLFDDVLTSGATATECALTMLEAGAGRVYVATIARAQ